MESERLKTISKLLFQVHQRRQSLISLLKTDTVIEVVNSSVIGDDEIVELEKYVPYVDVLLLRAMMKTTTEVSSVYIQIANMIREGKTSEAIKDDIEELAKKCIVKLEHQLLFLSHVQAEAAQSVEGMSPWTRKWILKRRKTEDEGLSLLREHIVKQLLDEDDTAQYATL